MKQNKIMPVYSRAIIGYKCTCGNKTDWVIHGIKRSRIIECAICHCSKIMSRK
jgi:hypothetical protein